MNFIGAVVSALFFVIAVYVWFCVGIKKHKAVSLLSSLLILVSTLFFAHSLNEREVFNGGNLNTSFLGGNDEIHLRVLSSDNKTRVFVVRSAQNKKNIFTFVHPTWEEMPPHLMVNKEDRPRRLTSHQAKWLTMLTQIPRQLRRFGTKIFSWSVRFLLHRSA
jgi:hypothetical protein